MFSGNIITITFLSSAFGILLYELLENKIPKEILKVILYFFILCCVYNILAGSSMVFDWVDPFSKVSLSPDQAKIVGRTAARRGGGLVILAVKFWPYILIAHGAFMSFAYFAALSTLKK